MVEVVGSTPIAPTNKGLIRSGGPNLPTHQEQAGEAHLARNESPGDRSCRRGPVGAGLVPARPGHGGCFSTGRGKPRGKPVPYGRSAPAVVGTRARCGARPYVFRVVPSASAPRLRVTAALVVDYLEPLRRRMDTRKLAGCRSYIRRPGSVIAR